MGLATTETTKNKRRVKVVQKEEEEEIPVKVIAQSIKRIGDAYDQMMKAGLTNRAIVLLIHDASGVSKTEVQAVLDGLDNLKRRYLK